MYGKHRGFVDSLTEDVFFEITSVLVRNQQDVLEWILDREIGSDVFKIENDFPRSFWTTVVYDLFLLDVEICTGSDVVIHPLIPDKLGWRWRCRRPKRWRCR